MIHNFLFRALKLQGIYTVAVSRKEWPWTDIKMGKGKTLSSTALSLAGTNNNRNMQLIRAYTIAAFKLQMSHLLKCTVVGT